MELVTIAVIAIDIFAINDVLRRIRSDVARFLWIICILFLPVAGAGFWYYVQYTAPAQKRIEKEERLKLKRKKERAKHDG